MCYDLYPSFKKYKNRKNNFYDKIWAFGKSKKICLLEKSESPHHVLQKRQKVGIFLKVLFICAINFFGKTGLMKFHKDLKNCLKIDFNFKKILKYGISKIFFCIFQLKSSMIYLCIFWKVFSQFLCIIQISTVRSSQFSIFQKVSSLWNNSSRIM